MGHFRDVQLKLRDFKGMLPSNLGASLYAHGLWGTGLVATIHFSPFKCCFRRFFRLPFTVSIRNDNAEFTQSLLCSLFTKFTGECNHSHVHSLFTANGSSERSSIHVSIGDTKTAQFIENKQTNRSWKGGANHDAM